MNVACTTAADQNEQRPSLTFENEENVPNNNGPEVCRWRTSNQNCKDHSESQELFSDDDQIKNPGISSPQLFPRHYDLESPNVFIKTPFLYSNSLEETPGKAVVPKTPADLAPFIAKTNCLWTSDMETPESKLKEMKTEQRNITMDSVDIFQNNATPRRCRTPVTENVKTEKLSITSPVLGGRKKSKKKVKRRLLTCTAPDMDDNVSRQNSISSYSDRVTSETASTVSNDFPLESDVNNVEMALDKAQSNEKLEVPVVHSEKNSNTSTQDFFSNASFSAIDKICNSALEEEKKMTIIHESTSKNIDTKPVIKTELIKEENSQSSVSEGVLERIAAIKRYQKPMRRSIDVNQSMVSKEAFLQPVRELELADTKFAQDYKKVQNIQHKSDNVQSFTQLSSLKTEIQDENAPVSNNDNKCQVQEVPLEIMDAWSPHTAGDNVEIVEKIKSSIPHSSESSEKLEKLKLYDELGLNEFLDPKLTPELKEEEKDDGILYLQDMELEVPVETYNEDFSKCDVIDEQQKQTMAFFAAVNVNDEIHLSNLQTINYVHAEANQQNILSLLPNDLSKIQIESEVNIIGIQSDTAIIPTSHDGFSTAKGETINIDKEKEVQYMKLLDEIDISSKEQETKRKRKSLSLHKNVKSKDRVSLVFNDDAVVKDNTELNHPEIKPDIFKCPSVVDGFSTAKGQSIKVNEEKEKQFMKLLNEIDVTNDEQDFKKNKRKSFPTKLNQKPNDRVSLVFKSNTKVKNCIVEENSTDIDFQIPKYPSASDGFSTATGKVIKVNEEKEKQFMKLLDEIDMTNNEEDLKKNKRRSLPLRLNQKPNDRVCLKFKSDTKVTNSIVEENHTEFNFSVPKNPSITDGFSTATGKVINVNEEKEKQFMKLLDELGDNEQDFKKNEKKTFPVKANYKPNDRVSLVFNNTEKVKHETIPKSTEISSSRVSSDGFSTAKGKSISINEEKEKQFMKLLTEIDVTDEPDFKNKRKSLPPKVNHRPNDRVSLVFKSTVEAKSDSAIIPNNNVAIPSCSSDGFATAGGKGICIDEEKEEQFLKFYNEIDVTGSEPEIRHKRRSLPVQTNNILNENGLVTFKNCNFNKCSVTINHIIEEKENYDSTSYTEISRSKLDSLPISKPSVASTTSHAAVISDSIIEKEFTSENIQINEKSLLSSTLKEDAYPVSKRRKSENVTLGGGPLTLSSDTDDVFNDLGADLEALLAAPVKVIPQSVLNHLPMSEQKSTGSILMKRKLETLEPKRLDRPRSFGGFTKPTSNDATKLNKSDPNDESLGNRPLQAALSMSQCFDPHSDSLLSKVDISSLNFSTKVKSPEPTKKVVSSDDFEGFTFQEITESFRKYSSFENYWRRARERNVDVIVDHGRSVSIINESSSIQRVILQHANNVEVNKTNNDTYVMRDRKVFDDAVVYKVPKARAYKARRAKKETVITSVVDVKPVVETSKRTRHSDTDSDTPLTSSKKPRISNEFPGRRLFSDESEIEDDEDGGKMSKTLPIAESKQEEQMDIEEDEGLVEERLEAVMQQEKLIRNKNRIKVKPVIGALLQQRLENKDKRTSWADLVGCALPKARTVEQLKQSNSDENIVQVNASNASNYKFIKASMVDRKRVASLDIGDGAKLIFDEKGQAGVEEFQSAFLAMPGVDPKLLPTGWIENHYKWIVWKLASVDRSCFDSTLLPRMLTPERVMLELKYRYDREIDRAQRPALRMILEKDDVPSKRMILCISSITEIPLNKEDGEKDPRAMLGLQKWKIEATDGWYSIPLAIDNPMTNYVQAGKIKEGTKILTYGAELCDCERGFHPLEAPPNVSLKIFTNSTRRAKWDAKLGYQKISRSIPVRLKDIVAGGGMVGEVTVAAARIYPLLYREKTADGQMIYRNARSEEKAAAAHERALESKVNAMFAEAEKNFESEQKNNRNNYEGAESIKQKIESQVRQSLPPPRDVTPVLKIRLYSDESHAMLTIWGATEDSRYDIKEGNTITVYNSFATGSRGGEMNLTANRMTHIKVEPLLKLPHPQRCCSLITEISSGMFEPKFNEFDTVGIVLSCVPSPHGMKNFEAVHLGYPKPNDEGTAYLSVLFWNGVAAYGYQGMFSPGTFVGCSNLEWRRNTAWNVTAAYCGEKSTFTTNPRQPMLSKELRNLKSLVPNGLAFVENCAEDLASELAKRPASRSQHGTPTERVSFYGTSQINRVTPDSVSIKNRLERLSRYGGDSPMDNLSPIVLNNSSTRVQKDYTPVTPR
ncbi:uncharacterized protein LOC106657181 isoform X1 [Trichogramma pretiosum]|uniref:uncharacterized protein LOC106657181 isoform X1 n=2 Tax=Trichogramma pretiosum TaxID=7493 RepID=UPI0006C99837|nr:uncharacterized protein LOC106657181 isoform X1 [Trichogramma pretiosum]